MKDSVKLFLLYSVLVLLLIYAIAQDLKSGGIYNRQQIEIMCVKLVEQAPNHIVNKNATYRKSIVDAVYNAQIKYNIEANWIVAIAYKESSFQKNVTGKATEHGLMQVHPLTAIRMGCTDLVSVEGQIDCGTKTLKHFKKKCGNTVNAFSAYASNKGACYPKPKTRHNRTVLTRMKLAYRLQELVK